MAEHDDRRGGEELPCVNHVPIILGTVVKKKKNADNENTHGPVTACIAIN